MRALGLTSGIGSMLVGARNAGFEIVGNVEWRKYYHKKDGNGKNTFTENFPGAFLYHAMKDLDAGHINRLQGVDLVMSHPECGNFSQLNRFRSETQSNPGDIPLFLEMVQKIQPRFFVMDDLPRAFIAFPIEEYQRMLPDYDLFPEWVSNYHYGNIQKNRKRMFMIGSRKEEKFNFIPGEFEHQNTIKTVIGDLLGKDGIGIPNHESHVLSAVSSRATHMRFRNDRPTWGEVRDFFANEDEGRIFYYHGPEGQKLTRPGFRKAHWNGHSGVLSGQNPDVHPITNLPLSIRERARIQGFPDDFLFYGTVLEDDGTWNTERNTAMIKQTGKAMPVQFCEYVSQLIAAHSCYDYPPVNITGQRFLKQDSYIESAKKDYCRQFGFDQQDKVCHTCHSKDNCKKGIV